MKHLAYWLEVPLIRGTASKEQARGLSELGLAHKVGRSKRGRYALVLTHAGAARLDWLTATYPRYVSEVTQ